MSQSVVVRDISSLKELKEAFARFCEEQTTELRIIDAFKIHTRLEELKHHESQLNRNVETAHSNLRSAVSALSICEDINNREEKERFEASCLLEKEEVIQCQKKLSQAEHNLALFKQEIRKIEQIVEVYRTRYLRKYGEIIQWEKESAIGSLQQLIDGLEDYLSRTPQNSSCKFSNGFGIADNVAGIDPTMTVAVTAGTYEFIFESLFSFIGMNGDLLNAANKMKNGVITTSYLDNGQEYNCSELKIDNNRGKIVSVNIPPSLRNEQIGKHLIQNMEINCRANDCSEIFGWAKEENVPFYKNLGYESRNEIKGVGSEVFKPLNSNFLSLQQKAKDAFQNTARSSNADIGKQEINPLYILSPIESNDEIFWKQKGENKERYIDLIEKYEQCKEELSNGKSLDEIRKENFWIGNAYDLFHGSELMDVVKSGNYYQVSGNGRHRTIAAQIYYLKTGKIINLPARVTEKKSQ